MAPLPTQDRAADNGLTRELQRLSLEVVADAQEPTEIVHPDTPVRELHGCYMDGERRHLGFGETCYNEAVY
jgi:hypothetical protein